jgi:hypothetical protein
MAWGQSLYLGTQTTGLSASSLQLASGAVVLGARSVYDAWGLRGGLSLQIAPTFFKGNANFALLWGHEVYGGGGLGFEYKIMPALPTWPSFTLFGVLGYEHFVTRYWSLIAEMSPHLRLGSGDFWLNFTMGLNVYFEPWKGR